MKAFIKKSAIVLAACFGVLFLYANLRPASLTESLDPVHLKIFSLSAAPDAVRSESITTALRRTPGVTACSVNAAARTVSVTFHPAEGREEIITELIAAAGDLEVAEKTFPPTPVCPVPLLSALKNQLLNALKIF